MNKIRITLKGYDKGQEFLKSVLKARIANSGCNKKLAKKLAKKS